MAVFDKILSFIQKSNEDISAIPEILNIDKEPNKLNRDNPEDSDLISVQVLRRIIDLVKNNQQDNLSDNELNDSDAYHSIYDQISNLYKDTSIPRDRLQYYKQIEEVHDSFPIARRVIHQYITSICKVDPITNRIIIIKENEGISDIINDSLISLTKKKINLILTYYDIEDKLKNRIVPNSLKYGNYYVEIIDKNEILGIDNLLQEDYHERLNYIEEKIELFKRNINNDELDDFDKFSFIADILFDIDLSLLPDDKEFIYENAARSSQLQLLEEQTNTEHTDKDQQNNISDKLKTCISKITVESLSNIELRLYSPHYVIPIHNEQKILGYLIFSPDNNNSNISAQYDITKYLSQIFNQSQESTLSLKEQAKRNYKKFVDFIISKLYERFRDELDKLPTNQEKTRLLLQTLYKNDKQLFSIIRDLFVEKKIFSFKVRYVPADRIVNFIIDSQDWPYGQSVIEPLIFYSKLYMLTLLSNVITKISRASVIRKWILDVGIAQQQGNLVQQLKRELTNKIITIDSIGSLSAIPRILTDYKDLITLQKNGRSFVDFMVQQTGDPTVDIQDLDFLKSEIISLSKVPSPYLGLVDTVELREQLVTANIIWAETISSYQQQFIDKINELINKIYLVVNKETYLNSDSNLILPSDIAKAVLNQPVMLQLQYLDAVFVSMSNTLQLLSSTPDGQNIDIIKFLKKFIPTIDWDEFLKTNDDYKRNELQQITTQNMPPNNQNNSPF